MENIAKFERKLSRLLCPRQEGHEVAVVKVRDFSSVNICEKKNTCSSDVALSNIYSGHDFYYDGEKTRGGLK